MSLEGNDGPPGIGNSSHKCRCSRWQQGCGHWISWFSPRAAWGNRKCTVFGLLLVTYWNLLTTLSSSGDLQGLPVRPPHPQVSETCALGMEPSPSALPGLGRQGVRLSLVLPGSEGGKWTTNWMMNFSISLIRVNFVKINYWQLVPPLTSLISYVSFLLNINYMLFLKWDKLVCCFLIFDAREMRKPNLEE